jgi:hypothetical protein
VIKAIFKTQTQAEQRFARARPGNFLKNIFQLTTVALKSPSFDGLLNKGSLYGGHPWVGWSAFLTGLLRLWVPGGGGHSIGLPFTIFFENLHDSM